MPELPEVETIVQQLKKKVLGRKILNIKIKDHLIGHKSLLRSKDQTILSVFRRGKYILIELDKGDYLMFHLRMTGFFKYFNSRENIDQRFLAVIFYLDDGSMLTFNCIRRFSIAKLLNKKELDQEVSKLGVEPFHYRTIFTDACQQTYIKH
ncbi:hypothetical protein HYX12_00450 [Candidatus Woesearchaeota archaeon]|nr:hypothetical protein [Candidatus Woesearchaeota archaeon]